MPNLFALDPLRGVKRARLTGDGIRSLLRCNCGHELCISSDRGSLQKILDEQADCRIELFDARDKLDQFSCSHVEQTGKGLHWH